MRASMLEAFLAGFRRILVLPPEGPALDGPGQTTMAARTSSRAPSPPAPRPVMRPDSST
jgi:hypothetical protein